MFLDCNTPYNKNLKIMLLQLILKKLMPVLKTHFLQVCPSGQPPSEVQRHTIGVWLSGYLQYSLECKANICVTMKCTGFATGHRFIMRNPTHKINNNRQQVTNCILCSQETQQKFPNWLMIYTVSCCDHP